MALLYQSTFLCVWICLNKGNCSIKLGDRLILVNNCLMSITKLASNMRLWLPKKLQQAISNIWVLNCFKNKLRKFWWSKHLEITVWDKFWKWATIWLKWNGMSYCMEILNFIKMKMERYGSLKLKIYLWDLGWKMIKKFKVR